MLNEMLDKIFDELFMFAHFTPEISQKVPS